MSVATPLAHLLASVVTIVNDEILETLQAADSSIVNVNYQYGPLEEIKETLKQWDKSKTYKHKKYPCIFLVTDTVEQKGLKSGYRTKHKCTIGIVYRTQKGLTAGQRITNSFTNILYPLYQNLLDNLISCGYFVAYDEVDIPHNKIDRLNMGKESFVVLDGSFDYLDAIELQNLELVTEDTNCLTQINQIQGQ